MYYKWCICFMAGDCDEKVIGILYILRNICRKLMRLSGN